jgi:predicted metal-binding protein
MPYREISYDDIIFDTNVQTLCITPEFKCPYYAHSWACPPEAPYMEEKISKYSKFFLIYSKFDLASYVKRKKKHHPKRNKQVIRNRFYVKNLTRNDLENEIFQFLREYTKNYEERLILWDGHCRVCEQKGYKKCSYEENEACRFPNKIRYSMEAVGIHVSKTVKNLDFDIEWPPIKNYYRFGLVCFS